MGSETLWPLGLYFLIALVVAGSMIGLSFVLGERHSDRATGEPYESGILSTGSARVRLSVKFYIVAMLFVIFDLEAVFIFAYAVAYEEVGWAGYAGMVIFVAVLVVGLIYEYRMGALDWEPIRLRRAKAGRERIGI
ncbi:MAG: NADH-quinone oxidoreductase subunit A [Deltaproteobacteria bacterium]|nr:NADH-quinone oxidoreductase subunit A [Deltaproteobacteria bacterium]